MTHIPGRGAMIILAVRWKTFGQCKSCRLISSHWQGNVPEVVPS